jgi:hypothetical protein
MKQDFPGIHLVGGLPFDNAMEAFRWVGAELRPWVKRVPDETGERRQWVLTQLSAFSENRAFEMVPAHREIGRPLPQVRLKEGEGPDTISFEPFRYAADAQRSYQVFTQAKNEGLLANAKFQIGFPSPLEPVAMFVSPDDQAVVLPAYEAATRASLDAVLDAVPHSQIVIQWEIPVVVTMWEGWLPNPLGGKEDLTSLLARIGSWVPEEVDLGFHLCYGDTEVGSRPDPADSTTLAEVADAIISCVPRRVDFLHVPTALSWLQPVDYAPLANLPSNQSTDFYLGVVHHQDGAEGAFRRARAAAEVISGSFGFATECGMGRYQSQERFRTAVRALRELALRRA